MTRSQDATQKHFSSKLMKRYFVLGERIRFEKI